MFQIYIFMDPCLYKSRAMSRLFPLWAQTTSVGPNKSLDSRSWWIQPTQFKSRPNAWITTLDRLGIDKGIATYHVVFLGEKHDYTGTCNRPGADNANSVGQRPTTRVAQNTTKTSSSSSSSARRLIMLWLLCLSCIQAGNQRFVNAMIIVGNRCLRTE